MLNLNFLSVMKNPRIYVGTWAKYNAGSLSGEWLALRDYDNYSELCEVMRAIHEDEIDPEPMIQDCEDFPEGFSVVSGSLSEEEYNDIIKACKEEEEEEEEESAGAEEESTESTEEETPGAEEESQTAVTVCKYSEKAIVVIGNTRPFADVLRANGGRFNARLSCGAGWIFQATKRDCIIEALKAAGATVRESDTVPARNSSNSSNSSTRRNSSTGRNGGGYPDTAMGGQKVVSEYAEKRGDPEYYKSRFSTGIRFPEGVYLFQKPRIENDFCFRDEGPEYDYYKELCNNKKLLEEHFIAHNMEQVREPKEGENMYIIKDSWSTDSRVYIRWADYPFGAANDQIVREATEREEQEYRLQLRAVRAEFGKRIDKYLKRFGTSKLHIWSYWADR